MATMSSKVSLTSHRSDDSARWPSRLSALCLSWKAAASTRERDGLLADLWPLLNLALVRYIRLYGQSYGRIDPEEVRDIASEKSMAFLRALEQDALDASLPQPAKICSYISTLARNGLVDRIRQEGRLRSFMRDAGRSSTLSFAPRSEGADCNVQREQFLSAICACVSLLTPKARFVWFLRAFYDMPSRKIAAHPDVGMTSMAVDMLLSRTRRALRESMEQKGFNAEDAPPGVFVELWDLLRKGRTEEPRNSDGE